MNWYLRDGSQKRLYFLREIGSISKLNHLDQKILNEEAAKETISVTSNNADPFDVLLPKEAIKLISLLIIPRIFFVQNIFHSYRVLEKENIIIKIFLFDQTRVEGCILDKIFLDVIHIIIHLKILLITHLPILLLR